MIPTEILTDEHRLILTVCGAAEREAQSMRASGVANAERVDKMLDFLRTFADRCHHAKEENLLFVRMTDKGIPREFGPVGMMLHEHEQSRTHLRAVEVHIAAAAAGDDPALAAVSTNLLAYATLLRTHIFKEDNILYPMANQAFGEADQAALAADFARVEREDVGAGVRARYERIARELAGE